MALYLVTSRQTIFEQTKVEANSEAEALQLAWANCGAYEWDFLDCADYEPFEAKLTEDKIK